MPVSQPRSPVEPLEGRKLCAATIGFAGHVLTVRGDGKSSNAITVSLSADGLSVVATDAYAVGQGAKAVARTVTKAVPLSGGIVLVRIVGGPKADSITIDQTYGSFPISTNIHAGGGNDTVMGGDEPDAIWGQGGNDLLNGGAGNDSLYGMAGRDTLIGGVGNDYLSGGTGHDSLEGDAGNDTLYDPFGPDTLLGGDGTDQFEPHSLSKDPVNDYVGGVDTLKPVAVPTSGDGGNDSITDILGSVLPFL